MTAHTKGTYAVAVFDVLGWGDRLRSGGLDRLSAAYDRLLTIVNQRRDGAMLNCAVPTGGEGRAAAFGYLDIQQDYYSDTIILWCPYNHFCFGPFMGICLKFFCEVLRLHLPMRGGIAAGEAIMEKGSLAHYYLGQPVDEAARVEKAQDWVGVSFGPSFNTSPYNSYFEPDQVLVFLRHRKPGYSQWIPGAVLDWPRYWEKNYRDPPEKHIWRMNRDPKSSRYYERTIEFCQYSRRNRNWPQTGRIEVRA